MRRGGAGRRVQTSESWITAVENDDEALQAWILALMLKRVVYSNRICTVIVTSGSGVTAPFLWLLRRDFDLVVEEPKLVGGSSEKLTAAGIWSLACTAWTGKKSSREVNASVLAKFGCWSLTNWTKCVYLPPGCLISENIDHLFDLEPFASVRTKDTLHGSGSDAGPGGLDSVFVFKPKLDTWKGLVNAWNPVRHQTALHTIHEYFAESLDALPGRRGVELSCVSTWPDLTIKMSPWAELYTENIGSFLHTLRDGESELKEHVVGLLSQMGWTPSASPSACAATVPYKEPSLELLDSIAVIGASCRFPGVNNMDEYWSLLAEGRSTVRSTPPERKLKLGLECDDAFKAGFLSTAIDEFDAAFFGMSAREAVLVDPQQRMLLELIWEALENAGIPPRALEGSETGSYLGIYRQDYDQNVIGRGCDLSSIDSHYVMHGNWFSSTAARISHFLGLRGSSLAVESGCASSLAALHTACEALRRGEVSLAISSGVNLILGRSPPWLVLSPEHSCKTFDEDADGFARAEGVGVVILQRTRDAIRDGNSILGLLRGSAMNNDGGGSRFGTPNADAQEVVYRAALGAAGMDDPALVTYIEAHGTGTASGDPTEVDSITRVYSSTHAQRPAPLVITSAKPNLGHMESAAGIGSLIKVLLALKHGQIPPHLNLKTLNPKIQLDKIPGVIPNVLTDWNPSRGGARIAGVSAFGVTGTNVHVVVQEAPSQWLLPPTPTSTRARPELITISAKSPASLDALAASYAGWLGTNSGGAGASLASVAYTTNVCRAHNFPFRIALVGTDVPTVVSQLKGHKYFGGGGEETPGRPRIGFLFTGQGSQYIGMGQGLMESSPPFASAFARCADLFSRYLGVDLASVMWAPRPPPAQSQSKSHLLECTKYSQPALFCLQIALLAHWASLGVEPDFVLGHSAGEFAAAVGAGALTLEEGFDLVTSRAELVAELPEGRMLALSCGPGQCRQLLAEFQLEFGANGAPDAWIDVAAFNSVSQAVVSGPVSTVEAFETWIAKRRETSTIRCSRIQSNHAFHSRSVDPILGKYEDVVKRRLGLGRSRLREPESERGAILRAQFVSGSQAKILDDSAPLLSSRYWVDHLRKPVRFADAVRLIGGGASRDGQQRSLILIEIGPSPVLLGLARATLDDDDNPGTKRGPRAISYLPSLRRTKGVGVGVPDDSWSVILSTAAQLYVAGVDLDWRAWYKGQANNVVKAELPNYQFYRQSYWYRHQGPREPLTKEAPPPTPIAVTSVHFHPQHPILGTKTVTSSEDSSHTHTFCASLSLASGTPLHYITDHKICGRVILPGALYIEAVLAFARSLNCSDEESAPLLNCVCIENVVFEAVLELAEVQPVQMTTTVSKKLSNKYEIHFYCAQRRHARATLCTSNEPFNLQPKITTASLLEQMKSRLLLHISSTSSIYEHCGSRGAQFGPRFQCMEQFWMNDTEGLALVSIPTTNNDGDDFVAHPCPHPLVLDSMLQTVLIHSFLKDNYNYNYKNRGSGSAAAVRLPFSIRSFNWFGNPSLAAGQQRYYVCVCSKVTATEEGADAELYTEAGALLATMEGVQLAEAEFHRLGAPTPTQQATATPAHASNNPVSTPSPSPSFFHEIFVPVWETRRRDEKKWGTGGGVVFSTSTTTQVTRLIAEYEQDRRWSRAAIGSLQNNLMCFYYMLRTLHECGWSEYWPPPGSPLPEDLWEAQVRGNKNLQGTRLHHAFLASLEAEGYIDIDGTSTHPRARVLHALPSRAECEKEISRLRDARAHQDDAAMYEFTDKCGQNLSAVVSGQTPPLAVLFPEDDDASGASRFYHEAKEYVFLSSLVAAKVADLLSPMTSGGGNGGAMPTLRILEVGAGTGATTGKVLAFLRQARLKYEYTFTDISAWFLHKAKTKFGEGEDSGKLVYKILDIELDPERQGFHPHTYDMVIAVNVMHATRDLELSLRNVRSLLQPAGVILLGEQFCDSTSGRAPPHFLNISFATLAGWWRMSDFRAAARAPCPLVSAGEWERILVATGFKGAKTVSGSSGEVGVIVAQAASAAPATLPFAPTWVLISGPRPPAPVAQASNCNANFWSSDKIGARIKATGRCARFVTGDYKSREELTKFVLDTEVEGVIYLAAAASSEQIDNDHTHDIVGTQKAVMGGFLQFMQAMVSVSETHARGRSLPRIFVVTQDVFAFAGTGNNPGRLNNPGSGTIWGAFRAFVNEVREYDAKIVDISCYDESERDLDALCALFCDPMTEEGVGMDKFLLIRGGKTFAQKLARLERPDRRLKVRILKPESTYLITGGLGGLGLEVTKWMCGHGAKHIVLVGRSEPPAQIKSMLLNLEAETGATFLTLRADVGDPKQCDELMDKVVTSGCQRGSRRMPPLGGLFLASGVLSDGLLLNQSWEKYNAVFHAKVYPAWWFHRYTLAHNLNLEFFTMFSSMVATLGGLGQSNHAAASAFLNGLAEYRRSKGLPGSVINWGGWSEVGAAAARFNARRGQEGIYGTLPMSPAQGVQALERFMMDGCTNATILIPEDGWRVADSTLNLGSFLQQVVAEQSTLDNDTRQPSDTLVVVNDPKSSSLPPPGTSKVQAARTRTRTRLEQREAAFVGQNLEKILREILHLSSDLPTLCPDQDFVELGLDSLLQLELRNKVQQFLSRDGNGPKLSLKNLAENRTLRTLTTCITQLLKDN